MSQLDERLRQTEGVNKKVKFFFIEECPVINVEKPDRIR